MEHGLDFGQEMRTWVSPSLIEANYILSLSRMELEHVIATEMEANPALEADERATCPLCGSVLDGTFCSTCLVSQGQPQDHESYEDFPESMLATPVSREDSDEFDPMTLVAAGVSIPEQILADARTVLEIDEYPVAEYLIDALDERGFLALDLDELAASISWERAAVESVLEVIQDVAPVGVGARDLQECLLLQLRHLHETGHVIPSQVHDIVALHLAEFGAHKYGHIARALDLTTEQVEDARDFIRFHLNPFPLQSQEVRSWRSPSDSGYVAPDVIISLHDDILRAEVVDAKHFHLHMNPLYDQLSHEVGRGRGPARAAKTNGAIAARVEMAPNGHGSAEALTLKERRKAQASGQSATNGKHDEPTPGAGNPALEGAASYTSDDDRTHIRQYSSRARLFISNIQQRRDTLLKISLCLCELQDSFLRGGVRDLRPLTRAVVAQQVGVHESTVSRATANKFVMLPSRKVVPFSDFFTPSLSTKDVIKELIERESKKGEPLTDRRICDLLLEDGIRIARRTVAKYRAELGILPSTMR